MNERHDYTYFDRAIQAGARYAVIDIDNTLTWSNIGNLYFYYHRATRRHLLTWLSWFGFTVLPRFPLFLAMDAVDRSTCQLMTYALYRRMGEERIQEYSRELFQRSLRHRFNPCVHDLIPYLQRQGVEVVLLSTTLESIAAQYASHFGVRQISIPLARVLGRAPLTREYLRTFKDTQIRRFPPQETIAIADSRHDMAVLLYARFPVVVAVSAKRWMTAIPHLHIMRGGRQVADCVSLDWS